MDAKAQRKVKIRAALHWIFGVVALISLAATLLLSPLGDFLRKPAEDKDNIISTTGASDGNQGESADRNEAPPSTTEAKQPKKYSLLIYKNDFISAVEEDITIIYAKSSKDATMTITPIKGTSFKALSDNTAADYKKTSDFQEINCTNSYNVYSKTVDNIVYRVYCIDDGEGSSIEIKYQYPKDNKEIEEGFDILLSMFKVF